MAPTDDKQHRHQAVAEHVLERRDGVPYEVVRHVCFSCRRVLSEQPLRRAAA